MYSAKKLVARVLINGDLISQVEDDQDLTGVYPESVHAEQIYRHRVHRAWCKETSQALLIGAGRGASCPLGTPCF